MQSIKELGPIIRERRKKLKWPAVKLATLAGITPSFLYRIETGTSVASWETYAKLAGVMGHSLDALMPSRSNVEHADIGWRNVPVLDYVQAGRWRGVILPGMDQHTEKIPANLEHPPSTFAMRILGDSMQPKFDDGDIVVIAPPILPMPGDYVVAVDGSGDTKFLQYREIGRNDKGVDVFELLPLNPLYPRWRSDVQQIAIVGTMVEHRSYRRR